MTSTTLGGWLAYVMREADGALSLEEALHVIMDSMKDYFPCQSVAVILIDDDTKALRIKISRQISYTFVKQFHKDGPSPIAERVVLQQEPLLFNDVTPDSDTYAELKLEHDLTSAVIAPIVKERRGVGYIFCDRKDHEPFGESDLLHIQVVGYLIGNLIEKYELVRERKSLSLIDDATQALQYKAFIPALATEMQRAKTHNYGIVLALISVAMFRNYVETHGIDAAHSLLAEVVTITKECIRDMDILARFGADEFVLLLSGMPKDDAQAKLQEISDKVLDNAVGQADTPIRLSIGALIIDGESDMRCRIQNLLAQLGRSLVQAKSDNDGNINMVSMERDNANA
jgi:diguanylate cyclase (GGDEF)-like protein